MLTVTWLLVRRTQNTSITKGIPFEKKHIKKIKEIETARWVEGEQENISLWMEGTAANGAVPLPLLCCVLPKHQLASPTLTTFYPPFPSLTLVYSFLLTVIAFLGLLV